METVSDNHTDNSSYQIHSVEKENVEEKQQPEVAANVDQAQQPKRELLQIFKT